MNKTKDGNENNPPMIHDKATICISPTISVFSKVPVNPANGHIKMGVSRIVNTQTKKGYWIAHLFPFMSIRVNCSSISYSLVVDSNYLQ
jgi:hypothetical protein